VRRRLPNVFQFRTRIESFGDRICRVPPDQIESECRPRVRCAAKKRRPIGGGTDSLFIKIMDEAHNENPERFSGPLNLG